MSQSFVITLPWPPSVNTYWRSIMKGPLAGRVLLSEKGRDYRKAVAAAVFAQQIPVNGLTGKLAVWIHCMPPDRRARDLDNLPKGVLDSLHHAGVIRDDCDIDDLRITRFAIRPGGQLQIQISEIAGEATESADMFGDSDELFFAGKATNQEVA